MTDMKELAELAKKAQSPRSSLDGVEARFEFKSAANPAAILDIAAQMAEKDKRIAELEDKLRIKQNHIKLRDTYIEQLEEDAAEAKLQLNEFERGVFYAAYLICELHDEPGIAADVIREANLDGSGIKSLDATEKKVLLKLNKTEHLSLRND